MSVHAITFRIHEDSTYSQRYNSVVQAAKSQTIGKYWEEPTSFILIESGKSSREVADAIDRNSLLAPDRDLLLVVNLSERGFTPVGKVHDRDLTVLMDRR